MQLEHSFVVPVEAEQAWQVLLDVERIAPCMPGATLLSVSGEEFAGQVKVKLGPVNLTYKGVARFVEKDASARRVVISASGKESHGPGTAKATVTARLTPTEAGTTVSVLTDLAITGRPAQFGRGVLQDVSERLINMLADCLAETLQSSPATSEPTSGDDTATSVPASTPAGLSATPIPAPPATGATDAPDTASVSGGAEAVEGEHAERARRAADEDVIDLLQVTGVSALASRYRVQLITGLVGLVILIVILRRLTRA